MIGYKAVLNIDQENTNFTLTLDLYKNVSCENCVASVSFQRGHVGGSLKRGNPQKNTHFSFRLPRLCPRTITKDTSNCVGSGYPTNPVAKSEKNVYLYAIRSLRKAIRVPCDIFKYSIFYTHSNFRFEKWLKRQKQNTMCERWTQRGASFSMPHLRCRPLPSSIIKFSLLYSRKLDRQLWENRKISGPLFTVVEQKLFFEIFPIWAPGKIGK